MFFQHRFTGLSTGPLRLLPGLLLLALLLLSCGGPDKTAQPTPTPASPNLQFTVLDLGLPKEALNAPVVGTVPDNEILHVGVTFKINQEQLDKMGKDHQAKPHDTSNSNDIAHNLGISEETYQQIKAYFGIENATLKLSKTRTNLTIDAKASSFARLLQTHFVIHKLNERTFFTPDPAKPPKLPGFLVDQILAVTGLDNYSMPPERRAGFTQLSTQNMQQSAQPQADCVADGDTVTPRQVAHAYGFDSFWKANWHGENMTVNLVEIDGFDEKDINNYFSCVGFKGKLEYVTIDGNAPSPGGETTLDIEMIAGLASAAHIITYQTDVSRSKTFSDVWGRVNDSLQQIINDNAGSPDTASVVSISLGMAEEYMTSNDIKAIDQSLQILTKALHMTVFVASGDCGAFTNHIFNSLSVSFPASDPYAVSVGGTSLGVDGNNNRMAESVWSNGADHSKCRNQWGSGGGLSRVFARPEWQEANGTKNTHSNGKRQLPDVSAIANNLPVYFQGQWIAVGGTSAAAPIWATGMLLVNQGMIEKQGAYFYGPDIFYNAANIAGNMRPYYDVTRGNNLYYNATAGWDYATGLGTPNFADFFAVLRKSLQ